MNLGAYACVYSAAHDTVSLISIDSHIGNV